MEEELKNNHQVYIVSPLIEENESLDLTTVNQIKTNIDTRFNKKYKSALEKRKILRESPELINQDKIEIDLPSGSCMLFKKYIIN